MDLRYNRHLKAEPGENGRSKSQHGRNSDDYIVKVPEGTTVFDVETNKIIADLTDDGQRAIIAQGGRGGRGNNRFKSSTKRAPRFSENGEPGEELRIRLELKLLADVGLVGFPNVGKSTLISNVSAAEPKIANYHFTTLTPNLGVVKTKDFASFVVADVPGLIEGAHEGVGLGDQFLRHLERTKVLVHVLDVSGLEGRDPQADFEKINDELAQFGADLLERPQLVAANKMDLTQAKEKFAEVKTALEEQGYEVLPISAATGEGIEDLINRLSVLVKEAPEPEPVVEEQEEEVVIKGPQPEDEEPGFAIEEEAGIFKVTGEEIERKVAMADLSSEEGLRKLITTLEKMGVEEALKEAGIEEGQTVDVEGLEFEYYEG
jgi:GTP-binding protein